jgi:hypothetical protein
MSKALGPGALRGKGLLSTTSPKAANNETRRGWQAARDEKASVGSVDYARARAHIHTPIDGSARSSYVVSKGEEREGKLSRQAIAAGARSPQLEREKVPRVVNTN